MTEERALELLALSLAGDHGERVLRESTTKTEYDAARCFGRIHRLKTVLLKKHKEIPADKQAERAAEVQTQAGKLASLIGFTDAVKILKKIGVEV